jgi:hypothetical protein
MNKKLRDITLFFIVAYGLTLLASQLPPLAIGVFKLNLLLWGLGPLVSGLVCYRLLKTRNSLEVSFLGPKPVLSITICIIPIATFCLTQTKNDLAVILVYALIQFAYCFGEEFGWRHYLQNATSFMNEWLQSLLIGLLWFLWHYSFLEDLSSKMLGSDLPALVFPPIMIVLLSLVSYLFGMMVKRSRSILFPTVGHLLFKTNLITMIVTGCAMCAILILWNKLAFGEKETVK